ncbi:ABC transporter permease [Lysobacter sp. A3-1-A15]|uniref:ABC transporter permease n=1 Tax=Novilysobacter viscosus TaxID=3098602 RepID=UPI002ED92BE2
MRALLDVAGSALGSIRAHGFRSLLTTLGIVIGVAAVIAVVSVMSGLSRSITQKFSGLGGDSLTVRSYTPLELSMQGRRNRLSLRDYEFIVEHIDDIRDVSPMFMAVSDFGTDVAVRGNKTFTRILATTEGYQDARQLFPRVGRFITDHDNRSRRRVCVIGEKVRDALELPRDPVGQFINIAGEPFLIVGVMEPRGEIFGFSQDDFVLIPFKTGIALGDGSEPDVSVTLKVDSLEGVDQAAERITGLLRQLHRLKPGEPNDFKVQTAAELNESFSEIVRMTGVVLAAMVSVSLLVGGIGIMNIMLVSVTERTREIGIAKALGATPGRIMQQFLLEAALLSFAGGAVGVAIGYAIGFVVSTILPGVGAAVVPWWAVGLSFAFSTAVGLVFGLLPAAKAARMDPITALRYE